MADCKACGAWFASTTEQDLCPTCERALKRLGGYVEPVKRGRWAENRRSMYDSTWGEDVYWYTYTCSVCGYEGMSNFNYCPKCGAKMEDDHDL